MRKPDRVAAGSEACVFGLFLVDTASSNPAGTKDVCLFRMLCAVQVDASVTGRSLIQGSQTDCVCARDTYNEYVEEVGLKETLRKRRILVRLYLWAELQGVYYFVTTVTTWQLQWKTRPCWQKCGVSLVFVIVVRSLWIWLRCVWAVWLNWPFSECPCLSPWTIIQQD